METLQAMTLYYTYIIRKWRWEVENIVVVLYVDYGIHHAKYNQNIPRDRCLFPIQNSLILTITGLQYKQ